MLTQFPIKYPASLGSFHSAKQKCKNEAHSQLIFIGTDQTEFVMKKGKK